jgi:large subunit ribosomal protein L6
MSRIGRAPVEVPQGVEVSLQAGVCRVKGPRGQLEQTVHPNVEVRIDGDIVTVHRHTDQPEHRALHGLTRSLIQNMVTGVTNGFRKSLEINGTGYRAELRGQSLMLNVGYSHPVELEPLDGAAFVVETPTLVHVEGIDKQVVGQQAALIRRVRPPEPYQGKGIRYRGEQVRRKAGKRG